MAVLTEFTRDDLGRAGDRIRAFANEATSMQDAAARIVDYLYTELLDGDGAQAIVLARLYKTEAYDALSPELQEFARGILGEEPEPSTRCLTLLATRGSEDAWNDPEQSVGHRAIPLPSVEFVQRLPMVHALIGQLGLDPADVVQPDLKRVLELSQQTYDVFHVEHALGSPVLPAQDFIEEYGVQSALGFGGVLFGGDFFATVLFARVPVSENRAQYLRILSLAIRVALTPFARARR